MFDSDFHIQKKRIRPQANNRGLMAMSFYVCNADFTLNNSLLFAWPQCDDSELTFITTMNDECKGTRLENIRQPTVLSTVDSMDITFVGAWVVETLTMAQSTTLFSFLDYQAKTRYVIPGISEQEMKNPALLRTEKHLAVLLDSGNPSMMGMLISTLLNPQGHKLESLFSFIRSLESYWISYFLLSQMMDEDKEGDYQKISYVSKTYGVSESYFRKLCNDAFTQGPKKQLRLWRAAHSALQLIEKDNSISTIAGNNGYSSSSHFSYEIKTLFGITPREFKKLETLLHE